MTPSKPTVLLYSIALAGYAYKYRDCLATQRSYAARHGYAHVAVARPLTGVEPALSAWLKIPLMHRALTSGYDLVVYIDADCEIRSPEVPATAIPADAGDVLMALGRSGRPNSGVIAARRSDASLAFFAAALASVTEPVSEDDRRNLRYENGNMIRLARELGGVGVLPQAWNNSEDPTLDDVVRHYTGDLRDLHSAPRGAERVLQGLRRIGGHRGPSGPQPERRSQAFFDDLQALADASVRRYPALQR